MIDLGGARKNAAAIRAALAARNPKLDDAFDALLKLDESHRAIDRKSTRLNSSHIQKSRMPSSA